MISFIVAALCLCFHNVHAQSPEKFCSSARPDVTPLVGVTFKQVYDKQPYKIVVSELSEKVVVFDNVCFSYMKTINNDTYTAYDTRTQRDGGLRQSPSVTVDGGPGIVISSSASCTYIDYTFASIDECQVSVIYRYFAYGYCKADSTTDNSNEVYALTPLNNEVTDYCKNRILQVFNEFGFGDRSYYFYPQEQRSSCVSAQQCTIPYRTIEGFPDLRY